MNKIERLEQSIKNKDTIIKNNEKKIEDLNKELKSLDLKFKISDLLVDLGKSILEDSQKLNKKILKNFRNSIIFNVILTAGLIAETIFIIYKF